MWPACCEKWDLSADHYRSMSIWRIDNDASYADTAIWWLENNPGVWRQWVTDEAAAAYTSPLTATSELKAGLANRVMVASH